MKSHNFLLIVSTAFIVIANTTEMTPLLRAVLLLLAVANVCSLAVKIKHIKGGGPVD